MEVKGNSTFLTVEYPKMRLGKSGLEVGLKERGILNILIASS